MAVGGCESGSLDLLALECVTVAEHNGAEFFIVELAVAVQVILLEQGLHVLLRVVEADLFNGAHEIDEGDGAAVENVKVLEHLHKASFFGQLVRRFLQQLKFKLVFKPKLRKRAVKFHIELW